MPTCPAGHVTFQRPICSTWENSWSVSELRPTGVTLSGRSWSSTLTNMVRDCPRGQRSGSGSGTHLSALPAKVGPPSRVALSRAGSAVDVHIDDPVASGNTSMRTLIPKLYYYILYWEGPSSPQVDSPSWLLCFCSADTC